MKNSTQEELNELNEKNIEKGGENLNDSQAEEIQAVHEGRRTIKQVERLMSEEEILNEATENGLYQNMLQVCLAANISINGRLMERLKEPMNPEDLTDKIKAAMQEILSEINKESNGIVLNGDGSMNELQSIEESVRYGLEVHPMIKASMHAEEIEAISNKIYNAQKTGMETLINPGENRSSEIDWEKIFTRNEKEYNTYKSLDDVLSDYGDLFGKAGIKTEKDLEDAINLANGFFHDVDMTPEERERYRTTLQILEEREKKLLAEIDVKEKERWDILEEDENDPRATKLKEELLNLKRELHKTSEEIALEKLPSELSSEAREAMILSAECSLLIMMGVNYKDSEDITNKTADLLVNGSDEVKEAMKYETLSGKVNKYILREIMKTDVTKMSTLSSRMAMGQITSDEKNEYLVASLSNFIMYDHIKGYALSNKFCKQEDLSDIISLSVTGIKAVIPNALDVNGRLNMSRVVSYIQQILGYEQVTMENYKRTLLNIKKEQVENSFDKINCGVKFQNMLEGNDKDKDGFKIHNVYVGMKKRNVAIGLNLFRRMAERGGNPTTYDRMKKICENRGSSGKVLLAERTYDENIEGLDKQIDELMRYEFQAKRREIMTHNKAIRDKYTNEEKGAILLSALACYNVSQGDDVVEQEMRQKAVDVIGLLLKGVVKPDGTLDVEKLPEAYSKFAPKGKYAISNRLNNPEGIFEFANQYILDKVQSRYTTEYYTKILPKAGVINKTQEEEKVQRKEQLDNVPITDVEAASKLASMEEDVKIWKPEKESVKAVEIDETVKVVQAEKIEMDELQSNLPIEHKEKNIVEKLFDKIKGTIGKVKNKISSMFNNSASTTSSSGGVDVSTPKENQVSQNQSFIPTATLDFNVIKQNASENQTVKGTAEKEEEIEFDD